MSRFHPIGWLQNWAEAMRRSRQQDQVSVMDVPGFGVHPVLRVYRPDEDIPEDLDNTRRFLVAKDGTAYQVE